MLFYCKWRGLESAIVDADGADRAKEIAEKIGEDDTLESVTPIPPNTFAFSVRWIPVDEEDEEDEDGEHERLVIDAAEHVADIIEALEDAEPCTSQAVDDAGQVVRCARTKHVDEKHAANGLEW